MQADAYAEYNELYEARQRSAPVTELAYWAHGRKKFFELAKLTKAPVARLYTPQGTRDVRLNIDHIEELGAQAMPAFSPNNYQLVFERENTAMLNQIHSQDPFQPDARLTSGRGTSRAGKLRGDPNYKGRAPKAGLISDRGGGALSDAAAVDANAAIDEALRRMDLGAPQDVF